MRSSVLQYSGTVTVRDMFEDVLQCVPIPNQLQSW